VRAMESTSRHVSIALSSFEGWDRQYPNYVCSAEQSGSDIPCDRVLSALVLSALSSITSVGWGNTRCDEVATGRRLDLRRALAGSSASRVGGSASNLAMSHSQLLILRPCLLSPPQLWPCAERQLCSRRSTWSTLSASAVTGREEAWLPGACQPHRTRIRECRGVF
jgi:hypothetical protein